jgi:hypothetical protein
MYNRVQICGISTTQLPKVDQKKSTEMLLRIKGGEEHLKEQFITSNLRLVLSVVQKFYNRNENLDDLFQIGCIGLIKALENFDFKFNVRFSTYAVPTDISKKKACCKHALSQKINLAVVQYYESTSTTTPAPTVRPPSRIAKRSSLSIAIGVISSIVIVTLSPGMTISTPSGRSTTPVTSVVLK